VTDPEQIGILVHAADIFAGTCNQQPVSSVNPRVGQVRPGKVAVAGHAQNPDIELRQKGYIKKPVADTGVTGRYRCLDQLVAQWADIALADNADLEILRFPQRDQFRKIKLHDDPVTCPKFVVIQIMPDIAAQPLDRSDFQACPTQFGDRRQFLVDHRGIAANRQFRKEIAFVAAVKMPSDISAREQPATEQHHHHRACDRRNQAIWRNLENPETGQSLVACHRINDEVGRSPDQCGGAAQYADEAQRDQQFLGRIAGCPRKTQDDRNQDDHDGRVVHEGRSDKGSQKHLGDRYFWMALGALDDESGYGINCPGSQQCA